MQKTNINAILSPILFFFLFFGVPFILGFIHAYEKDRQKNKNRPSR